LLESQQIPKEKKKKTKETKVEFICKQDHRCFNSKDKDPVCSFSPCPLNLKDFGKHQRIIEYYLRKEEWDESFYYFRDLMSRFPIECSIEELDAILEKRRESGVHEVNKRAVPVGCRLYIEVDELSKLRNIIFSYESIDIAELSTEGVKLFKNSKEKFKGKLLGNLIRLEHLVRSKEEDIRKLEAERKYNIELTKAQMGTLKPKSLELPISKDVEDAITKGTQQEEKKKKKKKMSGI